MGNQFIVETDEKSLEELNQVVQTPEQKYYLSKLLGYDYKISFKPGKTNKVADPLSRQDFLDSPHLLILPVPIYDFLDQLHPENRKFFDLQKIHKDIVSRNNAHPIYKSINGIMYRNGRPVLSPQSSLKQNFLQEFYVAPTEGHVGIANTYGRGRLSTNFFAEV